MPVVSAGTLLCEEPAVCIDLATKLVGVGQEHSIDLAQQVIQTVCCGLGLPGLGRSDIVLRGH